LRAYAAAAQPALFELIDDSCPRSQRTAAGRYSEPMLFDQEHEGPARLTTCRPQSP
jgi:hypothetical protein